MDLYQHHNEPKDLYGYDRLTPKTVWEWHKNQIETMTPYESVLKQSPEYSYKYASAMKSRYGGFVVPMEHAVGKSAKYSYNWAMNILDKKPFPEGEEAIARNPNLSMQYAWYIIKGKWEKGEDAIATDAWQSVRYAQFVLGGRFPKGEEIIKTDSMAHKSYIDMLKTTEADKAYR